MMKAKKTIQNTFQHPCGICGSSFEGEEELTTDSTGWVVHQTCLDENIADNFEPNPNEDD